MSQSAALTAPSEPLEFQVPEASGPLLVAVESSGAKLDTRRVDADGQVQSHVRFDYLRSVPQYHFLDSASADRRPRLRVLPLQVPARATMRIQYYEVAASDDEQAQAWRQLARGQQRIDTLDEAAWGANLAALESAQSSFARLGLQQPAQWAAFLRAYYLYFPLYRYAEATAGVHDLLEIIEARAGPEPPAPEVSTLAVLAHQLAGQILLESGATIEETQEASRLEAARMHFSAARDLAARAGLPFEATWAINNLGIAYFYEDRLEQALELYAEALSRAESEQDGYLIALVGANVAVAQERTGRIEEAVHTLEHLQQDATMRNNPVEREHLLSLLGTYYAKLYRFPDALEALNEALGLSEALESSENRGRNRVMLARAYREMGQPEKAQSFAELAIPDLESVNDARGLRQAHRLLADIQRLRGNFEAMQRERSAQWAAQPPETDLDQADWLFNRAEDALAQGDLQGSAAGFRDSASAFEAAGFVIQAGIARLHACASKAPALLANECSVEQLQPVYGQIGELQASAQVLGARFAWIRLLVAQGNAKPALLEAERLVNDIQFYRQALPGVLGAWYWDAREAVLSYYLQLLLDNPAGHAEGRPDVLLALDRLRNSSAGFSDSQIAPPTASEPVVSLTATAESLRALLAQRDRAHTAEERIHAQRQIDRVLANRQLTSPAEAPSTPDELVQDIGHLPPDWSLLAYYLGGPRGLAWVGNRDGLVLIDLGPAAPILEGIELVKAGLRVYNEPAVASNLEKLNGLLLQPVQEKLRFNVLLAAGGVLSDLPLDAVPRGGRPFIENHQLTHIQSVRSVARRAQTIAEALAPRRALLGGGPDIKSQNAIPGTLNELDSVRAAFPTIEAEVFSGPSLTTEVFETPAFKSADLVHLASHAIVDRDYPELSRLMVSGGSQSAFLTPADLESAKLAARLIVLSACETVGVNRFDFDNRLGFVTQFLRQSDALVVASLWPVSDRLTAELMADFYATLAADGDVPAALRTAKLRQREKAHADDHSWAAFQLFSR